MPFTREQLFDVFAAYNTALWPGAVALWDSLCSHLRVDAASVWPIGRPGD